METRMRAIARHPMASPLLALCAIWLALYFPLLMGTRVLPWDAIDQFYPTVWFNAHSLRAGFAPWWNPFVYSGYPQLADPQGMLFSPLLMTWMLLRADPGATWFAWGVLLHMLMGAAAMVFLLRRMQATTFGALLAAMVFLGGGVAAARLEHVPMVLAYGYAPLVLLLAVRFFDTLGMSRAVAFGLASGAMATHLVQLTWLLILMTAAWVAFCVITRWRALETRARARAVAGLVLAALIAAVIALPQLLLTLAFSLVSNRHDLPLDAATPSSLVPSGFLTLLDPNHYHALRGRYNGSVDQVEGLFYIGALPLLLMLSQLRKAWNVPSARGPLMFFALVGAFAILYMLGTHTPFYRWLYDWLPGMHHFRRPADAAYLLNLSFAIATGLAASCFTLTDRRSLSMLLAAATCWLALSSAGMHDDTIRWDGRSAAAVLAGAGLWWYCHRTPRSAHAVASGLLMLLAVDYLCFNLNGSLSEARDNRATFTRDAMIRMLANHAQVTGVASVRLVTQGMGPAWDNLTMLEGFASTQGYNPLRYQLYDDWYGARDNGALPVPLTAFHPAVGSAMDRLLGKNYLMRKTNGEALPPAYVLVGTDRGRELWFSADTYPRYLSPLFIRQEQPTPGAFEATEFRDTAWMDTSVELGIEERAAAHRVVVTVASSTFTHVQLHVSANEGSGWVIANELDFPGWHARIDGIDVPIRRVNGMFRGVHVSEGEHELTFAFSPLRLIKTLFGHDTHLHHHAA